MMILAKSNQILFWRREQSIVVADGPSQAEEKVDLITNCTMKQ
jgi:hypothetical protein